MNSIARKKVIFQVPKDKHEFYHCVAGDGTYRGCKFIYDPHTECHPNLHVYKNEVSTHKPALEMSKFN